VPAPTAWSAPAIATTLRKTIKLKRPNRQTRFGPDETIRDRVYGAAVMHRLPAMGIRDRPIAPGSPWQNGFAERLIGSIRRECVDHMVVLGEAHLRRILTRYSAYYNELRTHRSLDKDAPIHRAIQHTGRVISVPVLGGLHHHYCRI
jgi:transposase InsO family protein